MPRECSVCLHRDHAAIDAALVAGRSPRSIGAEFALNHQAIERHRANHLPIAIRRAARAALEAHDASLTSEAGVVQAISAPHTNARPGVSLAAPVPSSPSSGTRARRRGLQLSDTPNAPAPSGATVAPIILSTSVTASSPATSPAEPVDLHEASLDLRRRALSILSQAEADGDAKTALIAIREARGVLEHMARLQERTGAAGMTVPLTESAEWQRTRAAIVAALADFPEARLAVAEALISTGAAS